jgi:hypothetical protein
MAYIPLDPHLHGMVGTIVLTVEADGTAKGGGGDRGTLRYCGDSAIESS